MLGRAQVIATVGDIKKDATPEWARLRRFVRYSRGQQKRPWLPDNVEAEYVDIAKKSASNWLDLVIRSTCQGLIVDAYGDDSDESNVWSQVWQANHMDAWQHALHRAAATCGYGFIITFPTDDGGVWMQPESATRMYAVYEDPGDEWPTYALRQVTKDRWELYDEEARYTITGTGAAGKVEAVAHNGGDTPVTKARWSLDLLGDPMGEVEPYIPIQDRIVDATFTMQMVAKYGAFPQRWIAGIDVSQPLKGSDGLPLKDENENLVYPQIKAYVDSILTAVDRDTKFGQFAAADLRQYVEALDAHIRHLAAISQTPPHYLLGSLVNLSAEALAAAESGLQRKIREKREVLGEGYEQALRMGALMLGDDTAATDLSSQVHWQDVESRSLAQTADALFKLRDLGVPLPMLFAMIPGWTQTDIERAMQLIEEQPGGLDALARELLTSAESPSELAG